MKFLEKQDDRINTFVTEKASFQVTTWSYVLNFASAHLSTKTVF